MNAKSEKYWFLNLLRNNINQEKEWKMIFRWILITTKTIYLDIWYTFINLTKVHRKKEKEERNIFNKVLSSCTQSQQQEEKEIRKREILELSLVRK